MAGGGAVEQGGLGGVMCEAFVVCPGMAGGESCDMRTAAYLLAVARVADAMAMRGLYP